MRLKQIVLRSLIARGPATIDCDDEQGDAFYSAEQHGKTALASTSAVKSRAGTWIKDRQTIKQTKQISECQWIGKVKISRNEKPVTVVRACMAIFSSTPLGKQRTFTAVVSHYRIREDTYDCLDLFHCSCLYWSMILIQCTSLAG